MNTLLAHLTIYVIATIIGIAFCKVYKFPEGVWYCFVPVFNIMIALTLLGCASIYMCGSDVLQKPYKKLLLWVSK